MTIVQDFQTGVNEALQFGMPIRIKYLNITYGGEDYYDDDYTLTQSGNDIWTSGVTLPITNSSEGRGSSEAVLLQQGKIFLNDMKLYIGGEVNTSGNIRIGLGSPIQGEYSLLSEGVIKWDVKFNWGGIKLRWR